MSALETVGSYYHHQGGQCCQKVRGPGVLEEGLAIGAVVVEKLGGAGRGSDGAERLFYFSLLISSTAIDFHWPKQSGSQRSSKWMA